MSSLWNWFVVVSLFSLILVDPAIARRARTYPPTFEDAAEHVYKTVDDVRLKAWVFAPDETTTTKRPAVVFFFGGGWRAGNPVQFEDQCRYLRSRGVVAITCDYRVAGRHGVKAVSCVEDAKSAIRWVRANADMLGVNPDQICASGGSAGGHVACCTGVVPGFDAEKEDLSDSSVPNAMVLFNPAVLLAPLDGFAADQQMREKIAGMQERTGVEPERISPVHHIQKDQPPTIIFHGTDDEAVSYSTVDEFTRRSTAVGNDVTLVTYAGAQHSFFNRREGTDRRADDSQSAYRSTVEHMDRFLKRLGWVDGEPTERAISDHVRIRRYLDASRHEFEVHKRGRVAFLGGSITEMNGYRVRVESWLRQQFPETEFEFINAGIASTCSHTGAFRLQRDVLNRGQVDLLFVEFAVNDDQDAAHSATDCVRGMEGIVRHALTVNPKMDIVMIQFPNDRMLATIQRGDEPVSSSYHEDVARQYGLSSIYLSRHVAKAIADEEMTWKVYGGTHPGPAGHSLTANLISQLLEQGWRSGCAVREPDEFALPEPLDASSFSNGRLISAADAVVDLSANWQRSVPDWDNLPGSKRGRFTKEVMLHTTAPDAILTHAFEGTAVGAYLLAGPDAGEVRYRIDDGEWQTKDLFHHFSAGLNYPRTVMFAAGLERGLHRLELATQPARSQKRGTAIRILALAVNE